MLGQLSGQEEPDSSLDLTGGDGGPLVVVSQLGGLSSNPLKDVVDKGVHDGHGLAGDTGVGVHLLQHLVDVDGVGLLASQLLLLLVALGNGLLGLAGLLGGLSGNFRGHDDVLVIRGELKLGGNLLYIYINKRLEGSNIWVEQMVVMLVLCYEASLKFSAM